MPAVRGALSELPGWTCGWHRASPSAATAQAACSTGNQHRTLCNLSAPRQPQPQPQPKGKEPELTEQTTAPRHVGPQPRALVAMGFKFFLSFCI